MSYKAMQWIGPPGETDRTEVLKEETERCHVINCRMSLFSDFFTPADNYHFLLIQDGRQGRRFHLGKILFRLLRIYTSLTSVEYRSKSNILVASYFCMFVPPYCTQLWNLEGFIWNAVNSILCEKFVFFLLFIVWRNGIWKYHVMDSSWRFKCKKVKSL